ncbi:MAG: TonB family protein [Pyrinomonadaceae bacterium]|nr:TonB family protein [Pyrinomonadaceae bacterium]
MSYGKRLIYFYSIILILFLSIICQAKPAPLSLTNILVGLRSKKVTLTERNRLLTDAVIERGITFSLNPAIEKKLKTTGASNKLIEAIKRKSVTFKKENNSQTKTKSKQPKNKTNSIQTNSKQQPENRISKEKPESKSENTDALQKTTESEISLELNKEDNSQSTLPEPFTRNRVILPPTNLGQMNDLAIDLVKPNYPAVAKKMNVQGKVIVQIIIDQNGKVISAKAVDGHTLLREESEKAAQKTIFKSGLTKQPKDKATGYLIYNFQIN